MTRIPIGSLLTPPNSDGVKPLHSFSPPAQNHALQQSAIHPDDTSDFALFEEKPVAASPESQLLDQLRTLAVRWSTSTGPNVENLRRAGIHLPEQVMTWDHLRDHVQYTCGQSFAKPTEDEYILAAQTLLAIKNLPVRIRSKVEQASSRKVLKDKDPKRRSLASSAPNSHKRTASSAASAADAAVQSSSVRRRSSKVTAKATGSEARSARAPSTKPAKESNWTYYIDVSPSFDHAVDPMIHALVAKAWDSKDNKKGRRDLSDDELKEHLHESEIVVAELLHLDCHRYLTSKRQMFIAFVERLRQQKFDAMSDLKRAKLLAQKPDAVQVSANPPKQKSWNKTEAQKTMGIDVSKGSWIFQFYKDLGWFDNDDLYSRFMPVFDDNGDLVKQIIDLTPRRPTT